MMSPRSKHNRGQTRLGMEIEALSRAQKKKKRIPMDDAVRVLIKDIKDRTEEDIDLLSLYFLENQAINLFWRKHGYGPSDERALSKDIARNVLYIQKPFKGTELFKKGQPAKEFYFILDGEINIVAGFLDRAEATVANITKGQGFGSLGLLDKNATRQAGAVTNRIYTKLLVFPSELYLRLFGERITALHERRYKILANTKAFKSWTDEKLHRAASITYEKTFMPGSHLAIEGQNIDNRSFIYIVVRGEVDMVKVVKQGNRAKPTQLKLGTLSMGQVFCGEEIIKLGNLQKIVEHCVSDRGQFSHYKWTATFQCSIACQVLVLSRHGFFELADDHALQNLRQSIPPVPSDNVMIHTLKETEKWSDYKSKLHNEYFTKMPTGKQARLENIIKHTENSLDKDREESIKLMMEIEKINLDEEEEKYQRERKVYRSHAVANFSRRRIKIRAFARFLHLTHGHHSHTDKHLKQSIIGKDLVKQGDFESLDRYLNHSFSNIGENFRGSLHLPHAETYIQDGKNNQSIFSAYSVPSQLYDAANKGSRRIKSDEHILEELLNPVPPQRYPRKKNVFHADEYFEEDLTSTALKAASTRSPYPISNKERRRLRLKQVIGSLERSPTKPVCHHGSSLNASKRSFEWRAMRRKRKDDGKLKGTIPRRVNTPVLKMDYTAGIAGAF